MTSLHRSAPIGLAWTCLLAGLFLGGCADQTRTRASAPSQSRTTTSTERHVSVRNEDSAPRAAHHTAAAKLPETTGIPACDDYLSSYLACHRAAKVFQPDQLQGRYDEMRHGLLRDSMDPDTRPQLAARCNALASALRDALHGKSCEPEPASTATTP